MRLLTLFTVSSFFLTSSLPAQETGKPLPAPAPPFTGQGILVGEVTPHSAVVQVRLTKTDRLVERDLPGMAGVVEFSLQPFARPDAKPVTRVVRATEEYDFIARTVFQKLRPGVRYICTTKIGKNKEPLTPGPAAEFKTLPGPEQARRVKFVVVTGMNYAKFHGDDRIDREQHKIENNTELPKPYAGIDKHLGYPSLASILKQNPDFFVGTGDNVYYDTPDKPRAETIPQLRQKWHEQFVQPRYRDLFSKVPTYWMIDDHDYRIDDGDNTGDHDPSPEVGRRMMLEQLPLAAHEDENVLTYRTHRVSRDLQIWFPENRMYRSPNAMEDGPKKTIWGENQKAWLKKTLSESDAKFKLLISPTPMVGPDDLRKTDNHCDVGGFQHEQKEFFDFLHETGLDKKHFYLVCGDRHWQYHSIHPSGIEEFSCGALVDANSRLGRKPGDPESTDPEGLIKQPYYQDPRSGGFLVIEVGNVRDNPTLTFRWHDENGKVLHKHTKQ
jgi:alkaline phosphatase/alkaline phosphatase D